MLDFSSSQKVDKFEQSLASFKQQIESGVILHTAFVSMQVPREINELCEHSIDVHLHRTSFSP